jgi:hypothetical protein
MSVKVTAQPECAWTAVSEAAWIQSLEPAAGQGDGNVEVVVAPNTVASSRQTHVTINDVSVQIAQEGAPCRFGLDPPASDIAAGGGTATLTVATLAGCTWTAVSSAGWLTPTSGATRTGPGTISYSASANPGPARTASVSVGDQSSTISQAAAADCTIAVAPTSASVAAAGDTLPISISAGSGCTWTATSQAPWVTVSPAAGTGAGAVALTIAANSGAARMATLSIGGQTVTLAQSAAGCSYEISPGTHSAPAAGGPASVTVTTRVGCTWTAVADAPWIVLSGGASGTGTGAVAFSIAPNGGPARSGGIRIADRTLAVSQEGAPQACAFALSGTAQTLPAAAGPAAPVSVTTGPSCTWTASTSSPWITITSPASTTGSGALAFSVSANAGAERRGTIAVAGQTYGVTQAAPPACTYTVTPTAQSIGAGGGAGAPITVTAGADCPWTASSNAPWLTIAGPSARTGSGTVTFTAAGNSASARTGTLTVAGRTVTISQATACSLVIAPSTVAISSDGGTASATVTTTAGCAWTAVSNDSWITITSGASGSGPGTVAFWISANRPAHPRTGTITIGPLTLTVNQASKKDD